MSGTQGPGDDGYDAEGYDESQRAEILVVTGDGPDDGALLTDLNPDLGGSEDDDDDLDELSMTDDEVGEEDDDAESELRAIEDDAAAADHPRLLEAADAAPGRGLAEADGLADLDRPVAVGTAIWPHGRWRLDLAGQANHAGTTRMEDRHDPMLTYAMTVLAANKQARLAGQRATFGRLAVEPNGTNAVPSLVTAWLDARASSDDALVSLVAEVERQADDRAGRDGTSLVVTPESVSGSVVFDPDLAVRLAGLGDWPVIPTQAGHDAALAGLSPSVHSTPSKASRELSYGKSQPRRLSSRLRCLARFAANDFTAAARRTLAAFEATLAGGSVRMMRSARLPVISR